MSAIGLVNNSPANSGDLFARAVIPIAHENETLFSWCARFHRLACNSSARLTSKQLFGHPSAGLRPDFPSHLARFHEITSGVLGPLGDLVRDRTLLGFYHPFLSDERASAVIDAMCVGSTTSAHHLLGLAASRLGNAGTLKACLRCVEEDLAQSPVAWWRSEHQWPSMMICRRHQQPLMLAPDALHRRTLKEWLLPEQIVDRGGWRPLPMLQDAVFQQMSRLAHWSDVFCRRRGIYVQPVLQRYTYLFQAKDRGWMAMDGSLRLIALRNAFLNSWKKMADWPGMAFLSEVDDANAGFLGQLLRHYPGNRHPLKHFVLMAFLFSSPEEFFVTYGKVSEIFDGDGETGLREVLQSVQRQLATLVVAEGRTVNSAALELGISPSQATKHLNKSGLPHSQRPHIVGTEKEVYLVKALESGRERSDISETVGVRRAFIKDYLSSRPALLQTWENRRYQRLKEQYRNRFLALLNDYPGLPIKALRRLPGNGFQWLYVNDRDWLCKVLPAIWRRN